MSLIDNIDRFFQYAHADAKIRALSLIFSGKLEFDGKIFRTKNLNSVLALIYQQTNELRNPKKRKRGKSFDFPRFSTQTRGRTGMEVNPLVFETSASTDSAIWANGLLLVCGCKGMESFSYKKIFLSNFFHYFCKS